MPRISVAYGLKARTYRSDDAGRVRMERRADGFVEKRRWGAAKNIPKRTANFDVPPFVRWPDGFQVPGSKKSRHLGEGSKGVFKISERGVGGSYARPAAGPGIPMGMSRLARA